MEPGMVSNRVLTIHLGAEWLLEGEQLGRNDDQQQGIRVVEKIDDVAELVLGAFAQTHLSERLAKVADLKIVVHARISFAAQPVAELEELVSCSKRRERTPMLFQEFRISGQRLVDHRHERDPERLLDLLEYLAYTPVRLFFPNE